MVNFCVFSLLHSYASREPCGNISLWWTPPFPTGKLGKLTSLPSGKSDPFHGGGMDIFWNHTLNNSKLTPPKISELQQDSSPWPLCYRCNALTNWAIKTHTLGAGQFVEFILTEERNETWRWCELQKYKFKSRYDHRSGNNNFKNWKLTRKKSYDYRPNWTPL